MSNIPSRHRLLAGFILAATTLASNGQQPARQESRVQKTEIHAEANAQRVGQVRLNDISGTGRVESKDYKAGQPAEEAVKGMVLPAGFKAELVAAEPEVVQPIAMCFDERGRLWVAEGNSYPQKRKGDKGPDRILIFEDTQSTGKFDKRTVFMEGLNLVSGMEIGFGGVWIGAAPHLLFIPKDANDKPGEPQVLLDGWGMQDTHETLNSFIWGPDGWLYGCHGVFTKSNVGKPGVPEAQRSPINAGVWRYHPVRHEFEVFAHGTSNPWGLDYDERGEFFVTACVIPHLYHIVPGARYQRQAGQHFNPYTYDDIKTIADHLHYAGTDIRDDGHPVEGWQTKFADPQSSAPSAIAIDTDQAGGGHAHCGLCIYQGDNFPPEYRGELIFGNLHGHRLVRDHTEPRGGSFTGQHCADFMRANDDWFIPIQQKLGPDGALYVSDWSDNQICHRGSDAVDRWDRSNGRIYRISHDKLKPWKGDLGKRTDIELAKLAVESDNVWQGRTARRLLMERAAAHQLDNRGVAAVLSEAFRIDTNARKLLRASWAAAMANLPGRETAESRNSPHERIRAWTIRLAANEAAAMSEQDTQWLLPLAQKDPSPVVRRELASLLQRLPLDKRADIATALLQHQEDEKDPQIPLLVWYGIEPLVGQDVKAGLMLANASKWDKITGFIYRRMVAGAGREAIFSETALQPAVQREKTLAVLLESARGEGKLVMPKGWTQLETKLRAVEPPANGSNIEAMVAEFSALFGEAKAVSAYRQRLASVSSPMTEREKALRLLIQVRDAAAAKVMQEIIASENVSPLRRACIQGLASIQDAATAGVLVTAYPRFSVGEKSEAVATLASTRAGASALLQAVIARTVDAAMLTPFVVRQLQALHHAEVDALITRATGTVNQPKADLAQQKQKWRDILTPAKLKAADLARGRLLFTSACGACHRLLGDGANIGPDLTGSNRGNLDYLLDNVLDPHAVIGKDYQLNLFAMNDGRVISGLVKEEGGGIYRVAIPGGSELTLNKAEVELRQLTKLSLMPDGLFDALGPENTVNVVAYLQQGAAVTHENVAASAEGVTRIEAESLVPKNARVTGGELLTQGMKAFTKDVWSGGAQLFWVSVQLGHTLTLTLPDLAPGTHDVILFPTLANNYGRFRIFIDGEIQEADLFHGPFVKIGTPVLFRNVTVAKDQPLKIVIEPTGANPDSKIGKYGFVFGLDRIEVAQPGNTKASVLASPSTPKTDSSAAAAKSADWPAPASGPLRIEKLADALSITTNEKEPRELVRFQTQPQPGSGVIVPSGAYFHPIRTPGGFEVTALAPKAHPYYRGLFMGYVDTRGVKDANFWGGGGGPIKGSAIVNQAVSDLANGSDAKPARFQAANEWQHEGTVLVKEAVQAEVHTSGSATILDLTYTFTAPIDHQLAHCNVGGLALPVRTDGKLIPHGPDGPVKLPSAAYRKNETNWPDSLWYGYTLTLPDGAVVSAAIIDHPANPETRWHCALGPRVLNPCISTTREVLLKANEPLTLRYRVVALDGAFDAKRMSELTREWLGNR